MLLSCIVANKLPAILATTGALEGGKFKTTVSRVSPDHKPEVISQADYSDTSLANMAGTMYETARQILPQQKRLNSGSGRKLAATMTVGWQPGQPFSSGEILPLKHRYPIQDQPKLKHLNWLMERDQGVALCAADCAKHELGDNGSDLISGYRTVAGFSNQAKLDTGCAVEIAEVKRLVNRIQAGGSDGEQALRTLREKIFGWGFNTAKNAIKAGQELGLDRSDLTNGTRFSLQNLGLGRLGKTIIQLWNLNKSFADGIRAGLGYPGDHILCPKFLGVKDDARPLQNVSEAIAYQQLVDAGDLKMEDLPKPYC